MLSKFVSKLIEIKMMSRADIELVHKNYHTIRIKSHPIASVIFIHAQTISKFANSAHKLKIVSKIPKPANP